MANHSGCFITFEGGEGAGKTTLIDKISDILYAHRLTIVKTREPGGTPLGEEIRNLLLNQRADEQMSPYAELCLFLASRAQHINQVILPALKADKVVLCDRFNDSTVAYQGYARNLGMNQVENFCSFICQNLKPLLTIYLDIDPALGLRRVRKEPNRSSRGGLDRIESEHLSFHQKIRDGFHIIAQKEPERFFVIDASQPQDMVLDQAFDLIEKKLSYLKKVKNAF